VVGLLPLLAVQTVDLEMLEKLPAFARRLDWFVAHRPDLAASLAPMQTPGVAGRRLLAIADRRRLERVLKVMLDEREFLSPYGIRSLSGVHADHPFTLHVNGAVNQVSYEPAESRSRELDPLSRVFPRRHRSRARRESSDTLDGSGRKTPAADGRRGADSNMSASRHEQILERLRAEYRQMPDLRLKLEQVQRLCGIERRCANGRSRLSSRPSSYAWDQTEPTCSSVGKRNIRCVRRVYTAERGDEPVLAGYRARAISPAECLAVAGLLHAAALGVAWCHVSSRVLLSGESGGVAVALGRLAGLLFGSGVLLQLVLVSRLPWIEPSMGCDRLYRLHRRLGFLIGSLLLAHPALLTVGYSRRHHLSVHRQFMEFAADSPIGLAIAALAVIALMVAVSTPTIRRRLTYERGT
jgi:hypothetical protein